MTTCGWCSEEANSQVHTADRHITGKPDGPRYNSDPLLRIYTPACQVHADSFRATLGTEYVQPYQRRERDGTT